MIHWAKAEVVVAKEIGWGRLGVAFQFSDELQWLRQTYVSKAPFGPPCARRCK